MRAVTQGVLDYSCLTTDQFSQRLFTLALNTAWRPLSVEEGSERGTWQMNARASELQAAENNLKQLMAEVCRAMEKTQEAIAKIVSKTATATAETESTTSSR